MATVLVTGGSGFIGRNLIESLLFRGDRALIRTRQEDYARLFAERQDVLDVGCGRGEFLQLLAERGIRARGVDLNHEMVALCREAGLDVSEADAVGYLRGRADGELGGLIAAQVVEHLEPDYLLAFLDEAFRALAPGSPIVLETINVASWSAFFSSYIRDLTHVRPLHPETMQYLLRVSGFSHVRVEYSSPVSAAGRLAPLAVDPASIDDPLLRHVVETVDGNTSALNSRLFGYQDYAVIGRK